MVYDNSRWGHWLIANREQLSLVIRYVHPDDKLVREDFLTFLECDTGVTGSCLAKKIIDFLRDCNLDLTKLWGQAYDGPVKQGELQPLLNLNTLGHYIFTVHRTALI